MIEKRLAGLIQKYLSGNATDEERAEVERWYESFEDSTGERSAQIEKEGEGSIHRSLERIHEKIEEKEVERVSITSSLKSKTRKRRKIWYSVAAAIVLFVIGEFFVFPHKTILLQPGTVTAAADQKEDFEPGGNRAVLTLGNGQRIVLDSSDEGILSTQGNTKVIKLKAGQLSYHSQGTGEAEEVLYNTISTPKGGQYQIELPDGSQVWLNAASSIRFPTKFVGDTREIAMTGEAYFEVAPNPHKPFIVKKGEMEVKVLGTHFNVMAYQDETEARVTLLEGKVDVNQNGQQQMLMPGEQAVVQKDGEMSLETGVDAAKAVAWKSNLFWFENTKIQEVMKELARWYDLDIEIDDKVDDTFTGSIPRDLSFSKVFEVLQKTGSMHYEINGERKVKVIGS